MVAEVFSNAIDALSDEDKSLPQVRGQHQALCGVCVTSSWAAAVFWPIKQSQICLSKSGTVTFSLELLRALKSNFILHFKVNFDP